MTLGRQFAVVSAERVRLPENWANPALLKWARVQVGLQPRDIESRAKIPADRILAWERGEQAPSLSDLETLAELYVCPVGYFFLDSPPDSRLALDFRGLAPEKVDQLSYETRLRLREFDRLAEYAASLIERLAIPWKVRVGVADLGEPVDRIARREQQGLGFTSKLRESWSTADDAFHFWRGAVEDAGVFVIALKLNPQEVRGASRWEASQPPAILVNHADMEAATGRVFTLLHEWAHLLVKRPGLVCDFRGSEEDGNLEHFANALAAEMIVPKEEFEGLLRRESLLEPRDTWGDSLLDRLRQPFKASKDVVAILLEGMGLARPGFYRGRRAAWDARKPFFAVKRLREARGRGTRAQRRRQALGESLALLIAKGYESGAISQLDLADLLDMRVEQAERFTAWVREEPGTTR